MQLTRNGVTIQVEESTVMALVMQSVMENRHPVLHEGIITTPPRIGAVWPGQGGTYAGIMRGRDGGQDYYLIVGDSTEETTWEKAKAAAASMKADGHKDFTLPFRAEQALQFANVPELFKKEGYWSCEQHAEFAGYAWLQSFHYGDQDGNRKDTEWRARAVRRLAI